MQKKIRLCLILVIFIIASSNVFTLRSAQAEDNTNKWVQVVTGLNHSLGVKADGTVWAWGSNETGQLGIGTSGKSLKELLPVEVKGLTDVKVVAAGAGHSVAVKQDGTVYYWGDLPTDTYAASDVNISTPTQVQGLTDVISVSANYGANFAVKKDGTVWSWSGLNNRLSQMPYLEHVTAISIGWSSTLAFTNNNSMLIWGSNGNGEKGDGTVGDIASSTFDPFVVPGFEHVISASGGSNYTLAVKADGTVWAWGNLNHIKDGAISIPTKVNDLSDVKAVTAGFDKQYVLKNDGTVWQWGKSDVTVAGDRQWTIISNAVKVEGLENVVSISAGGGWAHVVALDIKGNAWGWGNNESGELGINSVSYRVPPAMIGKDIVQTRAEEAAAKDTKTIKVKLDGTILLFDQPPVLINTKTMVPLRKIFEALGATIVWDAKTQTVTATLGETIVKLTIGDTKGYVNNVAVSLEQPAVIIKEKTLVPVRFIGESFGAKVGWDEANKTVILTSK
jgi:alpha-tubulin suppressor-like RCC1 family protein